MDEGVTIGGQTKIWCFCHVRKAAAIGCGCNLGQNVCIGDDCKIQNNVSIYDGVTIGNGVFLGSSCVFTNDYTLRAKYPKGAENFIKTQVKDGAFIGANATIVCGVTIHEHAMVGAGAVVTKDVLPYALVVGVPARFFGWVCECGQRLTHALYCGQCGREYLVEDGVLTPINRRKEGDES